MPDEDIDLTPGTGSFEEAGAASALSGTLGTAATADIGTGSGDVAEGDHDHDGAYLAKLLAKFDNHTELTIASGEITVTQTLHSVDGEGDAADDVDTISGGTEGVLIALRPENAARNITLKNGTGNILTGTGLDYVIPDNGIAALLFDGTNWRLLNAALGTAALADTEDFDEAGAAQAVADTHGTAAAEDVEAFEVAGSAQALANTLGTAATADLGTGATNAAYGDHTHTGISGQDFAIGDGTDKDVTITAQNADANKPKLKYNKTTSKWQYSNDGTAFSDLGSGGTGASAIADLTDVDLTDLDDGQVLVYDEASETWLPGTPAASGGDVIGPETNTANYVPQWDGADSKTLKNGLAVGTAASNLVQLDGDAKLPAVDGSQLTNLPGGGGGTGTIGISIDGAGAAISTGIKGYVRCPFAGTITKATLLADVSGSIVVDVWKCTYADYAPGTHPVDGDSITAAAPPTITTALKSEDGTLTGWTKTIAAGDCFAFNVNSCTTITKAILILEITKS
jgi:hypothetical protein